MPTSEQLAALERSADMLSRYYAYNNRGIFTMLDCLDGKPVPQKGVPQFIQQAPEYAQGISWLTSSAAHKIHCKFWLCYHKRPKDLGPEGAFEKAVQDADIFIPELTFFSPEAEEHYNSISNRNDPIDDALMKRFIDFYFPPESHDLNWRITQAVNAQKVLIKLIDLTDDDLERLPHLKNLYMPARHSAFDGNLDPFQRLLWYALMCYHREWLMIAKLGLALKKLPESLAKQPSLSLLFFLGAFHYGTVKKLKNLGVTCSILYNAESIAGSGVKDWAKTIAQTTFTVESGRDYALFMDRLHKTLVDEK